MDDRFDLQRFVDAQERVFAQVVAELRQGRKENHWMWFVFPQIHGLGGSPRARHYAISGRAEAEAYLRHPVLGPRLLECVHLVSEIEGRTLHEIFGSPDDFKFRSCMTLFAQVSTDGAFQRALDKYCGGQPDPKTLDRL
jgi:uncharacterized protein (DUF1810 family)